VSRNDFKPFWIRWDETAYLSDYAVRGMTPHQRLMYRNLVITSYYCATRPYLPDDDNLLWLMADADNLDQWIANRQAIMVKFTPVTGKDGERLLANNRVLEEWEELEVSLAQKKSASAKGVAARRQRALNDSSTTDDRAVTERSPTDNRTAVEVEVEREIEKEVETEVETEIESGGGVGQGSHGSLTSVLKTDGKENREMKQVTDGEKQVQHLLRSLYRVGGYTFDGKNKDAIAGWLKRGFQPHEIEGAYRRFLPSLAEKDLSYAPTRFCRGAGETIMVDVRITAIRMSCRFFHSLELTDHDVEEYILPALPEEPHMYIRLLHALNLWLDDKLSLGEFNREHQAALLPLTVEARQQYLKEHLATGFGLKPFLTDAPAYANLAMLRENAAGLYKQTQDALALYQPAEYDGPRSA
jgi:uncharacterized protein YdaU (DUF1376 family)